jgi:hypothetical protein
MHTFNKMTGNTARRVGCAFHDGSELALSERRA